MNSSPWQCVISDNRTSSFVTHDHGPFVSVLRLQVLQELLFVLFKEIGKAGQRGSHGG